MPTDFADEHTRDPDEPEGRSLERHTGADALLKLTPDDDALDDDSSYEIPVTNVSWTRDYTFEEIQHNGSLSPTLSTSEIRYNGSFEYEGQNPEMIEKFMHSPLGDADTTSSTTIDRNRPVRATLTIKEFNHSDGETVEATVTFERVLITSNDRDLTVGDASTTSFDWEAEDMTYIAGPTSDV